MTNKTPSSSAKMPPSRPVSAKPLEQNLTTTSASQPTGMFTIVRSSRAGTLRFTYDTNDAARQRTNLELNRGPAKVSTEK